MRQEAVTPARIPVPTAAAPILRPREATEEVELVDAQPLPRERSVGGQTGKELDFCCPPLANLG